MASIDLNNVDDSFFDVLKELGNIGAGNATTALSQLLNMRIDMKVPKAELLEFSEVGDAMGGAEQVMAGIELLIEGDIEGSIMFLLELRAAKKLVSIAMSALGMPPMEEEDPDDPSFNEMQQSALLEFGNIIAGAYLNSLSSLTNLVISPTPPQICVDMLGSIMSAPAIEFAELGDKMLLIDTKFSDDLELNGYFILVPTLEAYEKILTSLGM
ncbi:MAG: chemotaxis protein CheC [Lachnospiraceae bacterium]|nr:chemotaxis protein CheC [Lachnospiraceae bacterium]